MAPPITSDISTPSDWGGSSISTARVPGVPAFAGNAYSAPNYLISFTFDDMGNGSKVQYCFYLYNATTSTNIGFITPTTGVIRAEADPTADITADWATAATWGTVITMTGLTASTAYQVKGKARNEDGTETAYSSFSGIWMSYIALAYSPTSAAYSEEITTGNTKISGLSITGTSNVITIGYTLTNKTVYGDATTRVDVTVSAGVSITLTYDGVGTAPLFQTNGCAIGQHVTIGGTALAAANRGRYAVLNVTETALTLDNTTGSAESNIVVGADAMLASDNSVKIERSTDGAAYTDITSDCGSDVALLTASSTGTAHTNTYATCTYLGNSYNNTIYIRVTPYDKDTAANTSTYTTVAIDNRPLATTISEIHSYTWDKDTTPSFVAEMQSVVCGSTLYAVITATPSTGTAVIKSSAEELSGWMYEQDHTNNPGENDTDVGWTQCPATGVSTSYIGGGNRIRYTFQTPLTAGLTYSITIVQAEVVNVLI